MAELSPALAELLDALENPLRYVATENLRTVESVGLPLESWLETIRRLDPQTPLLKRLEEILISMRARGSDQKRAAAERALRLIEEIRQGGRALPDQHSYRRTEGSILEKLKRLESPIKFVKEVGPRRGEELRRFGLETVGDILYHLPFRYEDRRRLKSISQLLPGADETTVGVLVQLGEKSIRTRRQKILEGVVRDETGLLELVWFQYARYYKDRLKIGDKVVLHGRVESGWKGSLRIVHPDIETVEDEKKELGQIVPIYSKPGTFHLKVFRRIVHRALSEYGDSFPSVLPKEIVARQNLIDLASALEQVHRPSPDEDVMKLSETSSPPHRSLVFDELFYLELGMALKKRKRASEAGVAILRKMDLADRLLKSLPFSLTSAQQKAISEIVEEMARPVPMNRLLQGDVGSGKTLVALMCALVAIENGYQTAFMAPTELLAEQHFEQILKYLSPLGIKGALLTGEVSSRQRETILNELQAGQLKLVVGTHALIQEGVGFQRLGLGIIDEQHRFGVLQRGALSQRGENPDVLLLSATPIPRTLALTLYGDLSVSFLDEMPPGRTPIATELFYERDRGMAFTRTREELGKGHQAYIVYPLVEVSEKSDLRNATAMATELARGDFRDFRLGLIHGQMKPDEKDQVMRRFRAGDTQLLVSTTVIEVGIDVPNATVMVVEHAERFGLSQLHQLRGRVGRGDQPSMCFLIAQCGPQSEAGKRLRIMEECTDGFRIAEADLEMRGPGEFLGTRQSGLPDFRVANLVRDARILEEARREAQAWLKQDPLLETSVSKQILQVLASRWAGKLELGEIG
jgi:ATP-dependent DNA helicase RecG